MKIDAAQQAGSNIAPAVHAPASSGAPAAPVPPSPPAESVAHAQKVSAEAAQQAAARINEFLKSTSANVQFSVDPSSKHVIVRVVDTETQQLIRQVPSEEALAISHALDRLTGLLLAQKA